MKPDDIHGEDVALFRYRVIAPLLRRDLKRGEKARILKTINQRPEHHPNGQVRRIPIGTLRAWLRAYRQAGFDGLHPKKRSDRGRSRCLNSKQSEALILMRKAKPDLTVIQLQERMVIEGHMVAGEVSVPTLYRFFREQGLTRRDLAERDDGVERKPFLFPSRNACWQVDVMHGPTVSTSGGRRRKAYLIAFIDDATRLVPAAHFHLSENTEALADVFSHALRKRGLPEMLYADNGRVFRSRALVLACARLGIEQVHSKPYTPEGRGKIERFFRTVRENFLLPLHQEKRSFTLTDLNERFGGWLENVYHVRKHSGLGGGRSPLEAWAKDETPPRPLPPLTDLKRLFFTAVVRKVRQDCTIHLNNKRYEVGPAYRRKKITLRYAMSAPDEVYLDPGEGEMEKLRLVDQVANRRMGRRTAGES